MVYIIFEFTPQSQSRPCMSIKTRPLLRIEQGDLRISPSSQPFKRPATSIYVLLHRFSRARKVVLVQTGSDLPQIATAQIEGKADEGIELVLIERNRDFAVDTRSRLRGVDPQDNPGLHYRDGCGNISAVVDGLAGMPVADRSDALNRSRERDQSSGKHVKTENEFEARRRKRDEEHECTREQVDRTAYCIIGVKFRFKPF